MEKKLLPVSLKDIESASEVLSAYIKKTSILRGEGLDEILGCQVYLKPEMFQKTGSFKLRGATNKILSLTESEKNKGIIASSSGNHGLGVAFAANMLNVQATLVLPVNAPIVKVEGARALGANVILFGNDSIQRYKRLYEIQAEQGQTVVHSFDDPKLIAGQGTVGFEIMKELAEVDTVVVPLGGGGLLAGVACAVKSINKKVRVVGVEPSAIPRYSESRKKGMPVEVPMADTVADGLMLTKTGINTYPLIQEYVDEIIPVEDEFILKAMDLLYFNTKLVVEPSAAIGIAALLSKKLKTDKSEKVCFVLTGGNIDKTKMVNIFSTQEEI